MPRQDMTESKRPRPVVLCILDGWGCRADRADNGIKPAKTPRWDRIVASSPHAKLQASESFVGLPEGQMGNSEVGHMNIGAGRILYMDVTRIDKLIETGDLFKHPVLLAAMHHARAGQGAGRRLHLMGLLSDGGVHSMNTH